MKANQQFKMEDDAVSPVIGVILMVAITVVLAAVVFVLVSDLGGDSGVPNFPNAKVTDGGGGTIVLEHRGGDCITISAYTWQIGGTAVADPTETATTTDGNWCVGETLNLSGTASSSNTIKAIHDESQTIVFEKTIQLGA